jgi:hypothetical protein
VALLLWWEPLVRVVASFALLLIGYTWLFAWWRASQQRSDRVFFHHSRLARGGRRAARTIGGGLRSDHLASSTRTVLEMRQTAEGARLAGRAPWTERGPMQGC